MSKCCPPIEKIGIPGLDKIPIMRYLRDPVVRFNDLYELYPEGGEYGWFVFVHDEKTFAYWDADENRWSLLNDAEISVAQLRYMEITQELFFMSRDDVQTIYITIYDGYNRDKTREFGQINIERDSGDPYSDAVWNTTKGMNVGREVEISFSDLSFSDETLKNTFNVIAISNGTRLTKRVTINN